MKPGCDVPRLHSLNNPPNILLLMLGKNRKIISSITHQLSFSTNPLTVLLTPPNSSPIGSEGIEKCMGAAAALAGAIAESRLRTGETAGAGSGGHAGGSNAL